MICLLPFNVLTNSSTRCAWVIYPGGVTLTSRERDMDLNDEVTLCPACYERAKSKYVVHLLYVSDCTSLGAYVGILPLPLCSGCGENGVSTRERSMYRVTLEERGG